MINPKFATFAALSALAVGCGEGGPSLVSVDGTVTLNGKPLEGAIVQFFPDASNKNGLPAEDQTGPAGNYKAMTKGRSGVVPGSYRVVVSKVPPAANANVPSEFQDDPFMAQLSAQGPETDKKKKDTSSKIEGEFTREVPPGGGSIDFDVKASAEAAAKANSK